MVCNDDTFDYNSRGEVTSATIQPAYTNHYEFDEIGNNRWVVFNTVTNYYVANSLNQYTSISVPSAPPREPQYDLDGNLLVNGYHTFTWDVENRLTAIYSGGTLVLSNAYDHASRRVLKVTPTATHTYLYDGWNLVQESVTTTSGTTIYRYVWGKDLSGTLQGAGGVGGLVAVSINNSWYFPLYDNNGNVLAYVSSTGTIVAEYIYDAFGNTINQSGSLSYAFRHRFSTKYLDPETNLYYYGYRFYDPALMRWLNRDPIAEQGGVGLYGFVSNNGVSKWDYLGMSEKPPTLLPEYHSNFISIITKKAKYKKNWYITKPYYYKDLNPPETLYRKDKVNCGKLFAIEYEVEPAGGRNAFNTIGKSTDQYRLWDGAKVKTDMGWRNVFRYVVEVTFEGGGDTSNYYLWELIPNIFGQWTWRTIAPKTVIKPITSGSFKLSVLVRLRIMTDDRTNMLGINESSDLYLITKDTYEIKD